MKVYDTSEIRNIALLGHGGSGKTSLVSAILFASGSLKRLGSVDDGSAATDYDDEEVARKISLQAAVGHAETGGRKLNLIDTPGYAAFVSDAKVAVRAADTAAINTQLI